MGRRHGRSLQKLGDKVKYADIGDPWVKWMKEKQFDSVIIATWPQEHLKNLTQIRTTFQKIPVFVEKPLITEPVNIRWPTLSMVACNWRFCSHIKDESSVLCRYPSAQPLDQIHFVDAFWESSGKPDSAVISNSGMTLCLRHGKNEFDAYLDASEKRETVFASGKHHVKYCPMFDLQMVFWRLQLEGKAKQINSVAKASHRTSWLINALRSA